MLLIYVEWLWRWWPFRIKTHALKRDSVGNWRDDDLSIVFEADESPIKQVVGSLDHVLPRSRGGKDTWENLVWSSKEVNTRKADRLPHEAGLKLLSVPRAPKELPATALIRNAHGFAEWKLFLNE